MPNPYPSPTLKIGGVPCAIWLGEHGDAGGIRTAWTDHGLEVTIEFILAYKSRIPFIQALCGVAYWAGGADTAIKRVHPFRLPININEEMPDFEGLSGDPYGWDRFICVGTGEWRPAKPRVDVSGGVTGTVGWLYYDAVIIPAKFCVPPYQVGDFLGGDVPGTYGMGVDLSGYPYTSIKTKASGEVFQSWVNTYQFLTLGTSVGDVGLIRPRQELAVVRYRMPALDTEAYENLIGCVNTESMTCGTHTYDPESLLYLGYEVDWYGDAATGFLFCNITHQLMGNGLVTTAAGDQTSSWNYAMTTKGTFDRMVLSTDKKTTPYPKVKFIPVIWPEVNG